MRVTSADLLEFEQLRELLRRFISSPLGARELDRAEPGTDRERIEEALAETGEALAHERALEKPQPAAHGSAVRVRFGDIPDCDKAIAKLRIKGAVLEGKEVLELVSLLETAAEVKSALDFSADTYPRLAARAGRIADFRGVIRSLAGKVMPDGSLADDASVALNRLRREVERQQRKVQESLERFLREHGEQGVLQEDFVTIRNDRFVVPIIAGQQKHVEGVIHGSSGTGHTLFLEPLETIDRNNEMVRLMEEEAREVHRLLIEMTDRLREVRDEILDAVEAVGELEFVFAKARFAIRFGCVIPRFSPPGEPRLLLRDARHPLLEDVLSRQRKTVIPVSLALDGETRTLLVSGPNTGGKTVTIKTAGLLALMAQSGLPVPCAEAELPVFGGVLADIGDNQSIQESLSTFSAHIARLREMVEHRAPDSLVLLDELGRATDPDEGGALGVAVLEEFRRSGSFTLASTHLLALKVYGANTEGVLNASMGFDEDTLEPTYRLRTGAPGKSAGLDIASRLGLPAGLIERARGLMGSSERDIARFLNQLHQQIEEAEALRRDLARREAELAKRESSLAEDWKRREGQKLRDLESRFERVAAEFEQRTGEVLDEIREETERRKAEAGARRKVARARREFEEQFAESVLGNAETASPTRSIEPGVMVRLRGISQPARVRRLVDDEVIEVEAGLLKMQIPRSDVVEVMPGAEAKLSLPMNVSLEAGPRWEVLTQEVNVIGRRAEEAREEVDRFLDRAILASVDRVRIVHGHGMGVLKKVVTELLEANPNVAKFYPASPSEGGTGATIAELKD